MVLVNALLFLCLVGAWAYTEQQTRVVDDDALRSCENTLQNQHLVVAKVYQSFDLTNPRFGGPNVLEADVEVDGRTRTVRCAVTVTGTNSTDPVVVTSVEVLP
jgi:hypothetical protein